MGMFSEIAFVIELIALATGVSLLIWSMRSEGAGVGLAKYSGYLISIFAILAILFTLSAGVFRSYKMMNMMKNGCPMCQMRQEEPMTQDTEQTGAPNMMQNQEQKQQ